MFELVGEKALDYIVIRDYKNDPDEDHFEFYFDDDNQGNNLKRYFTNDNETRIMKNPPYSKMEKIRFTSLQK